MAWCDNCHKQGLRKEDVEFCYDLRKVVCHGCYTLVHPGWMPPLEYVDVSNSVVEVFPKTAQKIDYAISLDSKEGFKAQISYGELSFQFVAPIEQLKKYLGPV